MSTFEDPTSQREQNQSKEFFIYGPMYDGAPKPFEEVERLVKQKPNHRVDEVGEYEYWTAEYIQELSQLLVKELDLNTTSTKKVILELGAGSGALSRFLRHALAPYIKDNKLDILAVDSYEAGKEHRDFPAMHPHSDSFVETADENEALTKYRPDLVIMSWPPVPWAETMWREGVTKKYLVIGEQELCRDGSAHIMSEESVLERPEEFADLSESEKQWRKEIIQRIDRWQLCATDFGDSKFNTDGTPNDFMWHSETVLYRKV